MNDSGPTLRRPASPDAVRWSAIDPQAHPGLVDNGYPVTNLPPNSYYRPTISRAMASISGLDHVGIVVADLDEAIATFSSLFDDTRAINRIDSVREFDPDGNLLEEITFAYIDTGNGVYLELMEPVSVGNGTIGTFLERRGEGIHHISFWVEPRSGFAEFFAQLQETPFVTVGETPWQSDPESNRNNVYTYIHPSSAHGTLIELITPYRFENGDMKAVETSEEAD